MSIAMFKKSDATDVEVRDPNAPPPVVVETDSRKYSRIGWIIVIFGICGFLLWAMFAPLDAGVPISGNLAVATNRKAIQHLTGGTVDDILVKEGERVKAGQVLVRMNSVLTKSNAEITRGQVYSMGAMEARLEAERDGAAAPKFNDILLNAKGDPRASEAMALQNQLFSSRRAALRDELGSIDENIAGLRLQIKGLMEGRDSKKEQLGFMKEQLTGLRELSRDGYIARNRLLEVERTAAQISGSMSEDMGNIGRAQRQVLELGLRRSQRQQEYQREVRTQLSEVQKESAALASRLTSQDFELTNVEVKSPVDGIVLGMNIHTKGGVVNPGMRLMDVVPGADPLIIEGMVPVHLIDKIKPDLPVELMFSAFNVNKTPNIPGMVVNVAADRTIEERTGVPYYKMTAKVSPEGLKELAKLPVRAGMPVEIFVKTGERNMMSYLLKPIVDRAKTSMAED